MGKKLFVGSMIVFNIFLVQGCVYEYLPGPVDCDENPVLIELISVDDSDCTLKDGRVVVNATGGTGNYKFRIGDGEEQTDPVFEGVAAGTYEISVSDVNNCSATIEAVVKNLNGVNITFTTTDAGCNNPKGTMMVTATNGIPPYNFRLSDGDFTASNTFSDLLPGNYSVVVKDATGCEVTQNIKVKSGISFSRSVAEVIEANCAINDCHNGSQFPDFREFKNIHDNASEIKTLTGNRIMPEDGTLTQTEISMIACWVDDGAPNN
jgi:hypothetical protein